MRLAGLALENRLHREAPGWPHRFAIEALWILVTREIKTGCRDVYQVRRLASNATGLFDSVWPMRDHRSADSTLVLILFVFS